MKTENKNKEGIMKNLKMLLLFLLIVPVFLVDCAKTETIRYDEVKRAPKPESYKMKLYPEGATPKEYKEIGEVKMEASLNHPKEEIIKSLKKEAKKIGADAIVGLQELESSDSMKQSWAAKAVVWTDKK
jgi:hypothetical protein